MSLTQLTDAYKQHELVKRYRKATRKIKPSVVAIYVSIFVLIIAMVFVGYSGTQNSSIVANNVNVSNPTNQASVDNVVATGIAADVAQAVGLPITPNVVNLAISAQIESDFAQSINTNEAKPQIIVSGNTNRSVISYTVKVGEDVNTLAAKFGISADTIKWANNLSYNSVAVGTVLKILPVNGVLYKVKTSDTIDSIASHYGVDKARIILYNDLDVSGLVPNATIILPNAVLPTSERPGYVTPARVNYYFRAGSVGNTYYIGNCTWYAYERRAQLGNPVGSFWGNARTWAVAAAGSGYLVNNTPKVGAVLVDKSGWYGHVAIVERIASNGDITVSEMNYVGFNIISNRTISAGQAALYRYVH